MTRLAIVVVLTTLMTSCVGDRLVWMVDGEPQPVPLTKPACRSGVVTTEKRVTDVTVAGRTRNTVVRTDSCFD
jgi:hypothetical protein